ncbi:MAG: nuclear transport factor 2 family protein [Rhodospirillaceae bacterium]|nr:nuclear transport factor 2 family protein [Rhodospirillaceae bacterium]
MLKVILAVAAALFASLPASALEPFGGSAADHAEIQAFHDRALEKFNAGDVSGAVDDYLAQLRVLHTKSTGIRDRESLRTSWTKAFAPDAKTKPYLLSQVVDMGASGSAVGAWAYMVCNYASVSLDKATNKAVGEYSNGRYIAVMTKTAEGWKVLLDIDNGAEGAGVDLEEKLKAEFGS